MTPHGVSIRNLTVEAGGRRILDDVSLDFEPGRCHVILGPSGSGKTTLLRCLNRLVDLFPEMRISGRIRVPWEGESREILASGTRAEEVRRRVGMVFQNPHVLPVTIRENFRISLESVLGLGADEVDRRMTDTLWRTGLWSEVRDRLGTAATRLSGGQQQRLCLARALALDPGVLLLDEPTANLDFRATAGIEELILGLKGQRLVIVVSHSLDQAARLADRVAVMDTGRLVMETEREALPAGQDLATIVSRHFAGEVDKPGGIC